MKSYSFLKNTTGTLIVIITIVITLVILFNHLTEKSFYNESGSVKVSGTKENVDIYRDNFGVPHISAKNENDLYFALGYSHAQDRLWQMDLYRRIAEGRLAEILGKDALEYDKLFRTIGINKIAYSIYKNLSPKSKDILRSYCDGVNDFILTHIKNLPLEFDVLNYKPENWKPEHSVMLIRLLGWELNLSWYTDYMFSSIVKKYGLEKAKDFFPNYPEDAPFIVKTEKKSDTKSKTDSTKKISNVIIENKYESLANLGENFFFNNLSYRNFFGLNGTHIGSNAWVISGKKTEHGKPLLANDPHLVLQSPAKWYEVEMRNEQSGNFVSGFSIPGVPGIAIGTNNVISWGITNLMNDDADFYLLKRDSSDSHKYILKNQSFSIDSTLEGIKIKDVNDEIYFTVYSTRLGPVISNLEKTGFINEQSFKVNSNELLALRWTGYDFSDEIECFYDLNNARNWNDFNNALRNFNIPASNFVYADTLGNIGYHAAGKIPVRKNTTEDNFLIQTGIDDEWISYVNYDDLPQSFNPKEEYIVTANNKPSKEFKHYISNLYEPPYRAQRIEQILNTRNNFTANEFKLIQNDVNSLQAKEFCYYLFEAYKDSLSLSGEEKVYLNLLKKWDYDMKVYSSPASLFSVFEIMLYKNMYQDKLGIDLFKNYIFLKNIPVRNTSKLLKENSNWIFDNPVTGGRPENKNDVIKKSFREAIEYLKKRFNSPDPNKWYWGELHKTNIKHPLGVVQALTQVLNIGPYENGGNGTTVANAEYSFYSAIDGKDFESYLGASMRFIVDMSDVSVYQSILPSGQSGQPQHTSYKDQTRLWLNGEYKNVINNFDKLKKTNPKHLVLVPSK